MLLFAYLNIYLFLDYACIKLNEESTPENVTHFLRRTFEWTLSYIYIYILAWVTFKLFCPKLNARQYFVVFGFTMDEKHNFFHSKVGLG